MAGFHKLTAELWQVKVWSTDKGPAGTIQTTFVANEVSSVNHLYTVFVVRHQPGDLLICLLVFRDVELRKNQNLFSLGIVSHQDRIISALLSGYTTRFSQSR